MPLCLQAVRPAGTCAPAAWRVPAGAAARGTGETKGPAAGLASVRRALRQVDRALVASRALHFGVAVRESSRRLIRSSGRVSAWLRTRATLSGQQSARSAERAMEQFDHDVMLIGLLQAEVRDPGRRRRGCAGRYPGTASPPGLTPRCRLSRRPGVRRLVELAHGGLTVSVNPAWPLSPLLPIAADSGTLGQVQSRVEDRRSRRRRRS
jgi:hypothetical protein